MAEGWFKDVTKYFQLIRSYFMVYSEHVNISFYTLQFISVRAPGYLSFIQYFLMMSVCAKLN